MGEVNIYGELEYVELSMNLAIPSSTVMLSQGSLRCQSHLNYAKIAQQWSRVRRHGIASVTLSYCNIKTPQETQGIRYRNEVSIGQTRL